MTAKLFTTPRVSYFAVTGSNAAGSTITGSGKVTVGTVTQGVFEGQNAFQLTSTVTGTLARDGMTYPLAQTTTSWSDTNYVPLGSDGDEYVVITGKPVLPTAVKVGDTGVLYLANRYRSNLKTTLLGTLTVSYVIEADTANSVLLTLVRSDKDTSHQETQQLTSQFRVQSDQSSTPVKETLLDSSGSYLYLTYSN